MKQISKTTIFILAIIFVIAFMSCTKESAEWSNPIATNLAVNISVSTRSSNDPQAINSDNTFESLALYIYDNDAGSSLEQFILLPVFVPAELQEWSKSFEVGAGVKTIYALVNYMGTTLKKGNGDPLVLSETTSQQDLESLIAQNSSGFSSHTLFMVGKQSVTLTPTDNNKTLVIPVRHLQARVDVHVFKGPNLAANNVTLKSVTLKNQVLNTEVKFDYDVNSAQLVSPPIYNNQTINSTAAISVSSGAAIHPTDANAIFYSFQNLVANTIPLPAVAPSLEITILSDGAEYTYTGYLTDAGQLDNQYRLLQNTIYQVTAEVDINSQLFLNMTVLPWEKTTIDYGRPVTSSDLAFGPWGTSWGGSNGKTMHTNVGGLEDAAFSFELKAPEGANWSATLTNGLDFMFTSSTAGISVPAVSKGTSRTGIPYLIAVRAKNLWDGQTRDTEFYITVEGNEIPINPLIGGTRRYEGTDTRIKIKQVASYN